MISYEDQGNPGESQGRGTLGAPFLSSWSPWSSLGPYPTLKPMRNCHLALVSFQREDALSKESLARWRCIFLGCSGDPWISRNHLGWSLPGQIGFESFEKAAINATRTLTTTPSSPFLAKLALKHGKMQPFNAARILTPSHYVSPNILLRS